MRLIDADALKGLFNLYSNRDVKLGGTYALLIDAATTIDAVSVVRCRECKNWETDWEPNGFSINKPRHYCAENDIFPTGDWFCADGQRREDGEA